MKCFKLLCVGFLLLAMPVFSFAQKHWEISVFGGAMNYYGDLTPPLFTLKEIHPAGQLTLRRYFDRVHAVRLNILRGTLSGNDRNFDRNYLRGNSFKGDLTEVSLMGELDFKGRKRFSQRRGYQKMSSLYFFGGASMAYFKPTVTYGYTSNEDIEPVYQDWHLGMPMGGGLRIDANQHLVFCLEIGYRFTISDFLDGTQASGNAYKNDSYTFGGVSVGYRFFDKEKQKEEASPEEKQ